MRIKLLCVLILFCFISCTSEYKDVPKQYIPLLKTAFEKSDENRLELEKALAETPKAQKEGMAFLIAYMPDRDLTTLDADFLLENVSYAYEARETFPWAKNVPDSIFLNDVLPYVSLNETRERWRVDFYNRFFPYVEDCQDIFIAIDSINRNIRDEVMVDYSTRREKPDQSPFESIRQGLASCSGLSILLVDAFRAVGIPARIAGTPLWQDERGNHNWVEVWANGKWYFTEYYPYRLDEAWFFADAGKAEKSSVEKAIYASSFKPTETYFPLVWDKNIRYVHAENVTDRYLDLYRTHADKIMNDGNHIVVKVMMFKSPKEDKNSDDRVAANIDVFWGTEQQGGGRTAGPLQDMNNTLEFILAKNKTYTFKYAGNEGREKIIDVKIGEEPTVVKLYME